MPTADRAPRRVDGSMSLLVDMSAAALDPAYADAAARRHQQDVRQAEAARRSRTPAVVLALVLVLVGALTGIAAAQVRRTASSSDSARSSLVLEVRRETQATDALAQRADTLKRQVAAARDAGLGAGTTGRALAGQIAALELATGQVPVRGPGLAVTLSDAPGEGAEATNGRGGQLGDGRIYDQDLQDVANALWAAGAEAISINGQRLTALTAIRSAGESVLVDLRPLTSPYVLAAVGNVDAMEPAFADSATARRFSTYTSLYDLGFSISRSAHLLLPAASEPELYSARVAPTPRPTIPPTRTTPSSGRTP